jgi:hypothetical protein
LSSRDSEEEGVRAVAMAVVVAFVVVLVLMVITSRVILVHATSYDILGY